MTNGVLTSPLETARLNGILKGSGLRITESRLQVLGLFLAADYALAHAELEARLENCDRVTLYRTLTTFEEKGLLHRVLDDSGALKYALCAGHCQEHSHNDNHVHFKCIVCGRTECLEGVNIPTFGLPSGYQAQDMNLLVQGRCPNC